MTIPRKSLRWSQYVTNLQETSIKSSEAANHSSSQSEQKNKLRWYPQQPQRFIFRNLSEACCEAKRWKPCPDLALHQRFPKLPGTALQPSTGPVEPDLALHQGFLEPSPEPSPEPCWPWPGSAPKPPRPSAEPCPEPCWTWPTLHQSLRNLLRNPVEPDWLHRSLLDLLRNLLRNPVEPDLALHQSLPEFSLEPSPEPCWTWPGSAPKPPGPFPEPSPEPCWTWPGSAPKPPRPSLEPSPEPCDLALHQSLPGTFSGTLLNLTWLSTKVSWNLLWNPVEPDLALHQSLPDLHWNLLKNPVELDLALHQSLPGTFSRTFSGTLWPGSAPKPPQNLLRNPVEPDLAFHQCFLEPSPEPRWTWPGACTSAHRSYSGLKTPLAHAVGENTSQSLKTWIIQSSKCPRDRQCSRCSPKKIWNPKNVQGNPLSNVGTQ